MKKWLFATFCSGLLITILSFLDFDLNYIEISRFITFVLAAQFIYLILNNKINLSYETLVFIFHFAFIGFTCATLVWVGSWLLIDKTNPVVGMLPCAGLLNQMLLGAFCIGSKSTGKIYLYKSSFTVYFCYAVVIAAVLKSLFYFYSVIQNGGHMSIYTDGGIIRDSAPSLLKIIASGFSLISLYLAFLQETNRFKFKNYFSIISILSDMFTGTRGRSVYLFASILSFFKFKTAIKLYQLILLCGISVFLLILLSYFRESWEVGIVDYIFITLESLGGTLVGVIGSSSLNIDKNLIYTQIIPLLSPSDIKEIDTFAKSVSSELLGKSYFLGYGLSSSALAELYCIFGFNFIVLAYLAFSYFFVTAVKNLLSSMNDFISLCGLSLLPTVFYIWRSELVMPLVFFIKAFPFLLAICLLNMFSLRRTS